MSADGTQAPEFMTTHEPQPHRGRARRILVSHPEIRALSGRDPATALWTLLLVAIQLAAATALVMADVPWWAYLLVAYCFGAFVNHALFVLIHEYTHNLVFRSDDANRLWSILANVPIVFPAAIGFRNFHLLHHRYLGMPGLDPDIPGPREARWVGRSRWRKALWVCMFWFVQGVMRPNQVAIQRAVVPWSVFNGIAMAAAMAPLAWFVGWEAVAYLFLSTIFALGLHPVGARWFQEHYVFAPGQETYSYYGPLNRLCFNMGYHNEHHDFPAVPWSRLPAIRAVAPEAYDGLMHHNSWTRLLARIVLDRGFTPHDRIVRPARSDQRGISAQ